MLLTFLSLLLLFGMILGSFSSVIIYRLRSGEKGIFGGRSKCPHCTHTLGFFDLFPLFSYLFSGGKCRYCKKKISVYYPLLELSLGLFFVAIGYFLIDTQSLFSGSMYELFTLIFWLGVGFLSFIYTVYDILYLEIPESVLVILVVWIFLGLSMSYTLVGGAEMLQLTSILVSGVILGLLYLIMLGGLDEKYDVLIFLLCITLLLGVKKFFSLDLHEVGLYSSMIGVLGIFGFFFSQILVSKGRWMGGGDLRIAIVVGMLLGYSYWLPGLMITYFSGSIIGVAYIMHSKWIKKQKEMVHQIPFGPFLTIGLFTTLFFQKEIDMIIAAYFIL